MAIATNAVFSTKAPRHQTGGLNFAEIKGFIVNWKDPEATAMVEKTATYPIRSCKILMVDGQDDVDWQRSLDSVSSRAYRTKVCLCFVAPSRAAAMKVKKELEIRLRGTSHSGRQILVGIQTP